MRIDEGRSLPRQVRELFLPLLPGELAAGALATILAVAYTNLGLPVLFGSIARALDLPAPDGRAAALGGSRRPARSALDAARRAAARACSRRSMRRARAARHDDRPPRRRGRPLREGPGDRGRLQRGGAGSRPHGRPAPRHRQVHVVRPRPARRGRQGRGLAIIQRHPQEGATLVGQARRLRPGRRRDPLPPRARRRRRLPGRADRQRDPAGLAHPRDLLHLRHDDRARQLPLADDTRGSDGRAAQRRRERPARRRAGRELHRGARARGPDVRAEEADFETELEFERRVRKMAQPRSADTATRSERPGLLAPAHTGARLGVLGADACSTKIEGATHVAGRPQTRSSSRVRLTTTSET